MADPADVSAPSSTPPPIIVRICYQCKKWHRRPRQSYCLECHAERMRVHRTRYSELSPEAKLKANCRSYTNVLVRRGTLTRQPCEGCGAHAEKHHPDYGNPRLVQWLCRACHLNLHHSPNVAERGTHA